MSNGFLHQALSQSSVRPRRPPSRPSSHPSPSVRRLDRRGGPGDTDNIVARVTQHVRKKRALKQAESGKPAPDLEMLARSRRQNLLLATKSEMAGWLRRRGQMQELIRGRLAFLRRWFDHLDVDQSGVLEAEDMLDSLVSAGVVRTLKDVEHRVLQVDRSGKGGVTFEEFVEMLTVRQHSNKGRGDWARSHVSDGNADPMEAACAAREQVRGNEATVKLLDAVAKGALGDSSSTPFQLMMNTYRRRLLLDHYSTQYCASDRRQSSGDTYLESVERIWDARPPEAIASAAKPGGRARMLSFVPSLMGQRAFIQPLEAAGAGTGVAPSTESSSSVTRPLPMLLRQSARNLDIGIVAKQGSTKTQHFGSIAAAAAAAKRFQASRVPAALGGN